MRLRKVIARLSGILYLLLGGINLIGLLVPETRDQIVNLGATTFRYGGMFVVGVGLLMLRKWSAYLLVFVLGTNLVVFYTVYGGQFMVQSESMVLLSLIGPVFIVALFYYLWPVLKPEVSKGANNDA